jgi:hypothetical protein
MNPGMNAGKDAGKDASTDAGAEADVAEHIARLRRIIGAQALATCDMRHEAVSPADGTRPQICPRPIRSANIACSHTGARLALREAWLLLEKLDFPRAAERREELARVDYEISILDYRRYDAEAERRATSIAACIAAHRALGEEVEALRRETLAALDRASRRALQLKIAS